MVVRWGQLFVKEILPPVGGKLISGSPESILSGISTDSRTIHQGALFWALRGETYDGHAFVSQAFQKGAIGAVVERGWIQSVSKGMGLHGKGCSFRDRALIEVDETLKALGDLAAWWRRCHPVKVVGITGSSGKTTTKEMTAGILERGHVTLKSQGNFNNLIGLPLTLLKLQEEHECAVVEMGMNHPGEIARLTEIADPDIGVILNVGMAHIEGLMDLDGVARAKTELMDRISPRGLVILNGDDGPLMKRASPFPRRKMTFGLGKENDVRATGIEDNGPRGTHFFMEYRGGRWPIQIQAPGAHHIQNALAAASVALSLEEPVERIQEGLAGFRPIGGRFETIPLKGEILLVNDTYNANPSSLRAAIASVRSLARRGGRILVGLGDMLELGEAATEAHREAGRNVAGGGADRLFAMGDHAKETMRGAMEGGMPHECLAIVATHDEMVRRIGEEMSRGDVVLLKASRRMGLEKVVEGLRQWAEEADQEGGKEGNGTSEEGSDRR